MMMTGVVRIGNDPEVKLTPNGDQVMELSLAYNYGKKGTDGKKPTQWVSAALWGSRAEKLGPYLKKGNQVFVALSDVFVHVYTRKDGTQGHTIRAKIGEIELIGGQVESKPKTGLIGDLDDDIPFE
jgi:single-strand DNA-binding protein